MYFCIDRVCTRSFALFNYSKRASSAIFVYQLINLFFTISVSIHSNSTQIVFDCLGSPPSSLSLSISQPVPSITYRLSVLVGFDGTYGIYQQIQVVLLHINSNHFASFNVLLACSLILALNYSCKVKSLGGTPTIKIKIKKSAKLFTMVGVGSMIIFVCFIKQNMIRSSLELSGRKFNI